MNDVKVSSTINNLLSQVSPDQALDFFTKAMELMREGTITQREVEKCRAVRDVAITKILADYKLKDKYLDQTFKKQEAALKKAFDVVDDGLANKDYTKLNSGLAAIGMVIKNNPFQIFQTTTVEQRHQLLEDGELPFE